jgi:carbonic anhydrase
VSTNKSAVWLFGMAAMTLAAAAFGEGAHWGYSGEAGPGNWGRLDASYAACASGKNQSPIDLANFVEADLKPIGFAYKAGTKEILNNGHTVQVNYAAGSSITVDDRAFELKQFHFHAPSENRINGKHFAAEAHLVHADKNGNLAVVAVMLEEGAANPLLTDLWKKMPKRAGDKNALPATLGVASLLPADRDYYRFSGSLTTPPCSEGVRWLVIKQPASASKAQIEQFTRVMGHPNNRPVQPLNARAVLK